MRKKVITDTLRINAPHNLRERGVEHSIRNTLMLNSFSNINKITLELKDFFNYHYYGYAEIL